ncbi:MAG: winged helix-turn-helix transcriptional regulator [Candidatus Hodarchaeota archaeon]
MTKFNFNKFDKLTNLVLQARKEARSVLESHYQEIPHEVDRKDFEISFLSDILSLITRKWAIHILWELEVHQNLNFNELMRHLEGISSRSLSDTLKQLEQLSLINRVVEATRPPKVKYMLNNKGKGLIELSMLIIWFLSDFGKTIFDVQE